MCQISQRLVHAVYMDASYATSCVNLMMLNLSSLVQNQASGLTAAASAAL